MGKSPHFLVSNSMKDRIRQLMESMHMTQQTFANFTGLSAASLSSVFNDRTKPTLNTVEAIKRSVPNLNTDWLMFGKGSMFVDDASGDAAADNLKPKPQQKYPRDQELAFSGTDTPLSDDGHAATGKQSVPNTPNNSSQIFMKNIDKPRRNITEIRVFYDDQTWESFVPKK